MNYEAVTADLRRAYDASAAERDRGIVDDWKVEERWRFLAMLHAEGKSSLLEVGAGPGIHGRFFADQGLAVVCTDLSPEMVRHCRDKGLEAHAMDFLGLDFPGRTFDAVFAMNCLLHVPRPDFEAALRRIAALMAADGLFYLGQYGSTNFEGVWQEDTYEPKRFFSYFDDDDILSRAREVFDVVDFRRIVVGRGSGLGYHALVLRLGSE